MTKDTLDSTLFQTVINYNRLKSIIELAQSMVQKDNIPMAKQYLSIAQYSLEQTYITLEQLQQDVERSKVIKNPPNKKTHDTCNYEVI